MPDETSATPRLHAIGEAAQIAGFTPETLRVWERRYGRPRAVRLPSGHRRYTETQVRWLRRVAEALAHGHRPQHVIPLDDAGLDALLAARAPTAPAAAELGPLLTCVRASRGADLQAALEAHWDPADPVRFLSQWVGPFLRAVGRSWADGEIGVRHEHLASEVTMDLLRRLRAGYPPARPGPGVLLTTLAGERHALGLQMAALVCASKGVRGHILGVDTPAGDIAAAAAELEDIRLVGLSVSLGSGGVDTDRRLAALREALPAGIRLVVGGAGARGVRRGPRGVEYAEDLAGWAEALDALPAVQM